MRKRREAGSEGYWLRLRGRSRCSYGRRSYCDTSPIRDRMLGLAPRPAARIQRGTEGLRTMTNTKRDDAARMRGELSRDRFGRRLSPAIDARRRLNADRPSTTVTSAAGSARASAATATSRGRTTSGLGRNGTGTSASAFALLNSPGRDRGPLRVAAELERLEGARSVRAERGDYENAAGVQLIADQRALPVRRGVSAVAGTTMSLHEQSLVLANPFVRELGAR